MIPRDIEKLCILSTGPRPLGESRNVARELNALGINPESELGAVAERFNLAFLLAGENSFAELNDPVWPEGAMARTTSWMHETWELPANLIPLTSLEGEGGYLYDCNTGAVWDFELAYCEDFLAGSRTPMFTSFFDFLAWYLGGTTSPMGER